MRGYILATISFFISSILLAQNNNEISTSQIVDLGLSVKWAGWNVGASTPDEYGKLFGWGDPTGLKKNRNLNEYPDSNPQQDIAGTTYDIARVNWGGEWRLPTFYEMAELITKCTWSYITYKYVKGFKVTGPNGNSIFLPLAGVAPRTIPSGGYGNTGNYWTSTLKRGDTQKAHSLFIYSNGVPSDISYSYRYFGLSIRPVIGKINSSIEQYAYACFLLGKCCSKTNLSAQADFWYKSAKKYGYVQRDEAPDNMQQYSKSHQKNKPLLDEVSIQENGSLLDLIDTICVQQAGTLPNILSESERRAILALTIIGNINGTDIHFLRSMAGGSDIPESIAGRLVYLDLSKARIVKGGTSYSSSSLLEQYTSNDEIGDSMFFGTNLQAIYLPDYITRIGKSAFLNSKLETVISPSTNLQIIDSEAFSHCKHLKNIVISKGVTTFGYKAFSDCTELKYFCMPTTLQSIESQAFADCTSLSEIYWPESLIKIEKHAFARCISLESLTLPVSLKEIEQEAFLACENLKSITIPQNVNYIGDSPFRACDNIDIDVDIKNEHYKNLSGVLFDKTGQSLIQYTNRANKNYTIPDGVKSFGRAFSNAKNLSSIIISDGIKDIEELAFNGCENLISIVIPKSVTNIALFGFSDSFAGCHNLKEIIVDKNNLQYSSLSGVLYNKDYSIILKCPCKISKKITIPKGVEIIEESAFKNCENLTSIEIPEGVKTINNKAFMNCSNLATVVIPQSVTSIELTYSFGLCKKLTDVWVYHKFPLKLRGNPFAESNFKNCTLHVPKGSMGAYKNAICWRLFQNMVEF